MAEVLLTLQDALGPLEFLFGDLAGRQAAPERLDCAVAGPSHLEEGAHCPYHDRDDATPEDKHHQHHPDHPGPASTAVIGPRHQAPTSLRYLTGSRSKDSLHPAEQK